MALMEKNEKDILLQKYADVNRKLILANEQLAIANKKLKEYEEKAQKAEKASKMKSLFLANMSHENRTPLNAIDGFSRVLVETDSQEDRMKFYEIIESNNSRLSSLVNEILDLSRVESGEIVMKKTPTDLNELCSSIKNLFKFRCPDSVQLVWKKPLMSVTFNTDANRLTQVFSNLISNALKHTPMGSITYGYQILDEGGKIQFFVKDTGSGIAKEDLERIFETYVSRDAETTKNGYGLGLPLCKIIVEKLGGKITVESEEGKGSTFRFVMPFEGSNMILMDIRMPEMNGLDATRIIKEVSTETPVVALSAYAFEENIRDAKAAGCDDFMAKPFKVENLIEMVKKYLDD